MANRQIGTASSVEELLLSDISKQIDRLIQVIANGGGGSGTVTSVSVVSANGFAGSVATATTTPAITISTTITGILKGNGTAISAATAGTDYLEPNGSGAALTGVYLLASGGTLTGANTIVATGTNNVTYSYATLGAANGFSITSNSTDAASNTQTLFRVAQSGANATNTQKTFAGHITNVKTGGGTPTNVALHVSASGATNNYAIEVNQGIIQFISAAQFATASTSGSAYSFSCGSTGSSNLLVVSNTNPGVGTSGVFKYVLLSGTFAPTSGTATLDGVICSQTINQTGGANGQITSFNSIMTITAAATHIGFDHNPTNPNNVSGTHLAFRGVTGSMLLGDTTKSANTGVKVLILSNASTNATGAQTNGVVIHAKDASTGSANSTLAFYTEEAPEATATFTQTHRIKVWWNGTEYYLPLDTV